MKESDRIDAFAAAARALGMTIETTPDGFAVHGPARWHDGDVVTHHDHRIAMALRLRHVPPASACGSTIPTVQRYRFRFRRRAGGCAVTTWRAAVIGHPIAHSRSPALFARFAAASGVSLTYEAVDVAARSTRRDPGCLAR